MAVHYTQTQIEDLIRRFEAGELPKAEWTHEAHLVVAVWYCAHYPFSIALDLIRQNIIAHNESVGTPNNDNEGYHETLTKCWLMLASNYIDEHLKMSMEEWCNHLIASPVGKRDFPLSFYSPDVLFSVKARKEWVHPDRKPIRLEASLS